MGMKHPLQLIWDRAPAFSIGGQFLTPHRSKLNEDTVEILIYSQDWLLNEIEGNKFNFTCKFFF